MSRRKCGITLIFLHFYLLKEHAKTKPDNAEYGQKNLTLIAAWNKQRAQ